MAESVLFVLLKTKKDELDNIPISTKNVIICSDTEEIFVDIDDGTRVLTGHRVS